MIQFKDTAVYVDPLKNPKYETLPKADLILLTDIHGDHLDPVQIDAFKKNGTLVAGPQSVAEKIAGLTVINNGEKKSLAGIEIEAIPMYNLTRGPAPGRLFHEKGRGNGYLLSWGGKRIYISGDTECIPEMKSLTNIDVAFICMNLPYTMPPSEAAECIKAFRPKIVYPYHYRNSDLNQLVEPLRNEKGIEVRLRNWY